MLDEAVTLLENLNAVVDDKNRKSVSDILENVASASGRLDKTLSDFENLSSDLGGAAKKLADFTNKLDPLIEKAETTLTTGTDTLESIKTASVSATATLDSAKTAIENTDRVIQQDIRPLIERATTLAENLNGLVG